MHVRHVRGEITSPQRIVRTTARELKCRSIASGTDLTRYTRKLGRLLRLVFRCGLHTTVKGTADNMGWDLSKLVERAKAGDVSAFDELVRKTYKSTYKLALKLTGNVDDAFDVLQETYLRAFGSLKKFRADSSFPTWLYRITSNCASTLIAAGKSRSYDQLDGQNELADTSEESNLEEMAAKSVDRDGLRAALSSLPKRLQAVVLLRDVYGFAHKEIADRLGITEAAAKVRLHRGRLKLKEELLKAQKGRGYDSESELPKAV